MQNQWEGSYEIVQMGRFMFRILAWGFLTCIVAQVFIAGMATFSDAANWSVHTSFVKIFAFVPLIMFLLTFVGGQKGLNSWISLGFGHNRKKNVLMEFHKQGEREELR